MCSGDALVTHRTEDSSKGCEKTNAIRIGEAYHDQSDRPVHRLQQGGRGLFPGSSEEGGPHGQMETQLRDRRDRRVGHGHRDRCQDLVGRREIGSSSTALRTTWSMLSRLCTGSNEWTTCSRRRLTTRGEILSLKHNERARHPLRDDALPSSSRTGSQGRAFSRGSVPRSPPGRSSWRSSPSRQLLARMFGRYRLHGDTRSSQRDGMGGTPQVSGLGI